MQFLELLLITGKGIHSTTNEDIYVSKDLGKLRYSVPEFIKTNLELNKLIISINDAEKKDLLNLITSRGDHASKIWKCMRYTVLLY